MREGEREERRRRRRRRRKPREREREETKNPIKGEKKEADVLRHDVADILLKAKPTRSNLSTQQKKGLSYLKKNKDKIAIVPLIRVKALSVLSGMNWSKNQRQSSAMFPLTPKTLQRPCRQKYKIN